MTCKEISLCYWEAVYRNGESSKAASICLKETGPLFWASSVNDAGEIDCAKEKKCSHQVDLKAFLKYINSTKSRKKYIKSFMFYLLKGKYRDED